MNSISVADLSKIPFLDTKNLDGRFLSSLMFYDKGKWRSWIVAGDQLHEMKMWPAETYYFGSEPEAGTDINLHFLDFVSQRACIVDVRKAVNGFRDDLFNMAASIAKISHIAATSDAIGSGASRMVVTEIEYVVSLCRSIFDLLQEISKKLWDTVQLTESSIQKKKLKESFREMVVSDNKPATLEEIATRYGLPEPLAAFYSRNASFFLSLRRFRDNIVHSGSTIQTIFGGGESGFLISRAFSPFPDLDLWRDEEKAENDLVPLMPAIGFLIYRTLQTCEDFSHTMQSLIAFPPPVAPGMHIFMRGYFNEIFMATLKDAEHRLSSLPST